jgi:hypothetical protein
MGLDSYFYGEKELSPKSIKERKLIEQLKNYPFTDQDKKKMRENNDYLYISNYSNQSLYNAINQVNYTGQIGDAKGLKNRVDKMGKNHWSIITDVWYLRKANAIHNWFVQNAQDGVDDCGIYPIDDVLQSFIDDASLVLTGTYKPTDIMPTKEGFFFGGTDYDEWYYRDLKRTKRQFNRLLSKSRKGKWKYYYHSSW